MATYLFVGIDDHEESIAVKMAKGKENPKYRKFKKSGTGFELFRKWVESEQESGMSIYSGYEAGPCGPGLCQLLESWGWECAMLAPHSLDHSQKRRNQKCDPKDAERVLEAIRSHELAGSRLSRCWIPDEELRDHRELERYRISLGEMISQVKNRINGLCRRYGYKRPKTMATSWSKKHLIWLQELCGKLKRYASEVLQWELEQLMHHLCQQREVDKELKALSNEERYHNQVVSLSQEYGVGVLTAMVMLLELGKFDRFSNRQQIGAYIGLVPSQYDTGKSERKGRITRCGPWRIRKVLNQAVWSVVRHKTSKEYIWYEQAHKRIGKKKAIVAMMRRLAIRLWHKGLESA